MEIKIQKKSGNVSIQLKGNLDGSTACQVEQALDFIRGSGVARLEIDFAPSVPHQVRHSRLQSIFYHHYRFGIGNNFRANNFAAITAVRSEPEK